MNTRIRCDATGKKCGGGDTKGLIKVIGGVYQKTLKGNSQIKTALRSIFKTVLKNKKEMFPVCVLKNPYILKSGLCL